MINTPAQLESKLLELSPILSEKFQVSGFGYFGSFARNEQRVDSDVDILLDNDTADWCAVQEFLEQNIERKVDVVPKSRLRKEYIDGVMEDMRHIENGQIVGGHDLTGNQKYPRMKRFDWYLNDMRDAMCKIEKYTKDVDFAKFREDEMRVAAIQRFLITIGEASKNVPSLVRDDYPLIPWKELGQWRNELAHEYFGFTTEMTWNTVQDHVLPNVEEMIRIAELESKD